MLTFRASLAFVLTAVLSVSPAVASRTHRSASVSHSHAAKSGSHTSSKVSAKSTRAGRRGSSRKSHKMHGQQAIEPSRVTEIQQALIREHYLNGDPNGQWDATTLAAMQKFQADQGWQTKLMPDSRALKKLGLGADYSGAINAKTATFDAPPPVSTIPAGQVAGVSAGSGAASDNR